MLGSLFLGFRYVRKIQDEVLRYVVFPAHIVRLVVSG